MKCLLHDPGLLKGTRVVTWFWLNTVNIFVDSINKGSVLETFPGLLTRKFTKETFYLPGL